MEGWERELVKKGGRELERRKNNKAQGKDPPLVKYYFVFNYFWDPLKGANNSSLSPFKESKADKPPPPSSTTPRKNKKGEVGKTR
jgi:hypothetical protein